MGSDFIHLLVHVVVVLLIKIHTEMNRILIHTMIMDAIMMTTTILSLVLQVYNVIESYVYSIFNL